MFIKDNNFMFHHEKNFLNSDVLAALNIKFYNIFSEKKYRSVDDHIIELSKQQVNHEPLFQDACSRIISIFKQKIQTDNLQLAKLWLVQSTEQNSKSLALPYIPHFDKHRYFKAMVYLHDVTDNHGPIHLGYPKNFLDIEKRRNKLPMNYKELGLNTISNQEIEGNMISMSGHAGDVIFFDTNTPHKAGMLSEGYQRNVLRFDFDIKGLNDKPKFYERILKRLLKN
tara:strand:+ start:1215 stop:1892 length:678 start_codon:yes stop_codon:yes gene_type:complete